MGRGHCAGLGRGVHGRTGQGEAVQAGRVGEQRQGGWEARRKSVGGFPKGSLLGTDHDQTHCRHLLGRAADQSTEASLRASLPPEDPPCRADSWRCFWQLRVWKCVGGDGQACGLHTGGWCQASRACLRTLLPRAGQGHPSQASLCGPGLQNQPNIFPVAL